YLEARRLMLQEEYEPALAKITTVVESNPEFSRAQFYQAITMLRLNRNDEAKITLERYLRSRPDDQSARLLYDTSFGTRQTPSELASNGRMLLEQSGSASDENLLLTARNLLNHSGIDSDSEEGQLAEQL